MAKIDRVVKNFANMRTRLCCPKCHAAMQLKHSSFVCPAGHCYDLAAANYLNLAPQKPQSALYDEQLFATRRRVFAAGFYQKLCLTIADIAAAQPLRPHQPLTVIDAGCGEGFFARSLLAALPAAEVLALDLAKAGVVAAAKAEPRLKCLLADLAALPLPDNSADIILNILSPANYREFTRVLAPGGLLIKVVPGADYLKQVRAAYNLPAGEDSESAALLAALPQPKTAERLTYTLPVSAEQATDFLRMTPLNEHRTPPAATFTDITIDLQLFAVRF